MAYVQVAVMVLEVIRVFNNQAEKPPLIILIFFFFLRKYFNHTDWDLKKYTPWDQISLKKK